MGGRAAGSADNAQNTHFFMINDTGTYYLRHLDQPIQAPDFTEEALLAAAEASKVRVLDKRLDFPRRFPFYLDSNRFLSNLEGSTVFLPVVEQSIQYINGLMYLLTGPPGSRPVFVDDRNDFKPAGVGKWVKNGYLNPDITLPLSLIDTFRAHIESSLLLQNLMLCLQPMGLGGWIHASFEGPFLMGHPGSSIRKMAGEAKGLDFKWVVPNPGNDKVPPEQQPNPVAFEPFIHSFCPPNYSSMDDAVDAFLKLKYGEGGTYNDPELMDRLYKGNQGRQLLDHVPHYEPEVIEICKAVCNYIHGEYGRFPAHVDAIHVPGIWLQAHHLDLEYYDRFFQAGYTSTQSDHDKLWH